MGHMLCNFQSSPGATIVADIPMKMDNAQKIGQFLLRPVTVFTPNNFVDNASVQITVARKVMTLVLSVLLLPLTAVGLLIGMALLKSSSTYQLMATFRESMQDIDKIGLIAQRKGGLFQHVQNGSDDFHKIHYAGSLVTQALLQRILNVYDTQITPLIKKIYPNDYQAVLNGVTPNAYRDEVRNLTHNIETYQEPTTYGFTPETVKELMQKHFSFSS